MDTIEHIHQRVFDVLLQYHYQEKEANREFYFLTEQAKNDIESGLTIDVRLIGRSPSKTLISLQIKQNNQVYVYGKFDFLYIETINVLSSIFLNDKNYLYQKDIPGEYLYEIIKEDASTIELKIGYILSQWMIFKSVIERNQPQSNSYLLFIQKDEFIKYISGLAFYDSRKFEGLSDSDTVNPRLNSLEVRNFKGIKHILIEGLSKNIRWIFLTGENGFGKTSILQAIAAGLNGRYDQLGNQLIGFETSIKVILNLDETNWEIQYQDNNIIYSNSATEGLKNAIFDDSRVSLSSHNIYIATYGSSRLQVSAQTTKEGLEKQSPTTYSLFNNDGVLLDIEQRLKDTKAYFPEEFRQIVDIFQVLLPNLAKIEIDTSNKSVQVKYFEKDDEGNLVNEGITFTQLATGYRNIIAMIGDMIYRLSTKQSVENLFDLKGIVIIDELELHLHPKYQKLFVQKLTELFPHIQFIASTHSPIPLLGAPHESTILHVTRSEERGIEVEKLDIDFSVLTPNAILTSPIFGFQELIPESKPDDTMIRSEQTYQEVLLNDQLDKQIEEYLTEENKKELLSLLKK